MILFSMRPHSLIMLAGLLLPGLSRADLVTDSNHTLMQLVRDFSTGAVPASRNFAILQTSIFDAVNGVDPRYQSYRVAAAAAAGSSPQAAAAAAAHSVLTALYPSRAATFDATYSAQLSALPAGAPRDNGAAWGQLVATNILNWRAGDNASASVNYVSGSQPGNWRPAAPDFGPPDSPQWPDVTPWTLTTGSQFRPTTGPPQLNSAAYTAAYTDVFSLGSATGSTRTNGQTDSALFWSYNPGSQTAVGHWNSIASAVVAGKANTLVDNARIFAALNTALADAAIVTSDAAYTSDFWRPITAIHEAATDGNLNTSPLTEWEPLVDTPGSPEYISGNAVFAGAASSVLNYLIGTETSFTISSDRVATAMNFYGSFDDAAEDATVAGIYGGTQFRNSASQGLATGHLVGSRVSANYFQPALVPEPGAASLILLAGLVATRRRAYR